MPKRRSLRAAWIVGMVLLVSGAAPLWAASDVPMMTKEELRAALDAPGLVILDVRRGKDWTASEFKIKGAVYAPPKEFDQWVAQYPRQTKIVLYCA